MGPPCLQLADLRVHPSQQSTTMTKRPLQQKTVHAFFPPKAEQPDMDDDDDVVVLSVVKRERNTPIVVSDSEQEAEVLFGTSNKRARTDRLVIPDSDDEDDDEPPVRPAQEASLEETLDSSDEEEHEEIETKKDDADKEDELQPRPTPVPSAIPSVFTRTVNLLQEGIKSTKDIPVHDWQKRELKPLPMHVKAVQDGCTPFFKDVLRLLDAGQVDSLKKVRANSQRNASASKEDHVVCLRKRLQLLLPPSRSKVFGRRRLARRTGDSRRSSLFAAWIVPVVREDARGTGKGWLAQLG